MPLSHFVPASPSPSPCPQVQDRNKDVENGLEDITLLFILTAHLSLLTLVSAAHSVEEENET